jgi:hypothetical protein
MKLKDYGETKMSKLYVKLELFVPLNDDDEAQIILLDELKKTRKELKPRRRKKFKSERMCEFVGCDKEHRARGMCADHYNQWHRGEIASPMGDYRKVRNEK